MKSLIAGAVLLTLVTATSKTFADHHEGVSGQMPERYARQMDKVIGDWKVESVTEAEVKSDDKWTVTTKNRMVDGEPQPDQVNTMRRKE